MTPQEVVSALLGQNDGSTSARIVLYTRLPRTCAALLAGMALAVSGMVIQTVLNNPLASPGIIGVNSSAGFAVALVCAIAPQAQKYTPFVAFAGALAAFYCQRRVGHVEAGLRTYDKYSPFPEEMNRKLVTSIADLFFAPTENNKKHLLKEAVDENLIYITGNTVIDAVKATVKDDYVFENETLKKLDYENKRVVLVTAHRRENLGEPLCNICRAILKMVETHEDVEVVYPVHLNPAVREVAQSILGSHNRIHLIDPVDVEELHNLMGRCYMVMTDSGGLQEEAPSLGKPVLVLRNETERPEAIYAGTVKLAGVNEEVIFGLACELLDDKEKYDEMSHAVNPYGDGSASRRTVDAILHYFGLCDERPEDFTY